jgi:hypothetical protein
MKRFAEKICRVSPEGASELSASSSSLKDAAPKSISGRLLVGEQLVMPGGQKHA